MLNESKEETETEYLRKLLSTYANLHPSIREIIINSYLFKELRYAIKKKRLIKVAINKEIYNFLPLEVSRDKETRYWSYVKLVDHFLSGLFFVTQS